VGVGARTTDINGLEPCHRVRLRVQLRRNVVTSRKNSEAA
jgi:hypothetical protein